MSDKRDLDRPPIADDDSRAIEVLRVWAASGSPQQVTLRTTWNDPGAWGLLLVDVARHAANAYAEQGQNRLDVLARIRELWDAEWQAPTLESQDITDR